MKNLYDRVQEKYEQNENAFHIIQHYSTAAPLKILYKITDIKVIRQSEEYPTVLIYAFKTNNNFEHTSSHWSNISKNKEDLIFKLVSSGINYCYNKGIQLSAFVGTNQNVDGFTEAFNRYKRVYPENILKCRME